METGIGPHPEIMGFGPEADLLDGRNAVDEEFVDFRRLHRIDLVAERFAVDDADRIEAPDRIAFGLGQPFRVEPLVLAPHIAHDVVRERLADCVGRRREALDQIGKFVFRHI